MVGAGEKVDADLLPLPIEERRLPMEGAGQKDSLNGYSSADLRRERWAIVKRKSILSWDPAEKMPDFRELVARGDIEWLDLPESEILKGERLQNY